MTCREVAIYGAGGFGRGVAWVIDALHEAAGSHHAVCFIDDDPARHGQYVNDILTVSLETACEQFRAALVVVAIAHPRTREFIVNKVAQSGFAFATVIHPRTEASRWLDVGQGTIICASNTLAPNVRLGQHVHVNFGCTLGHDAILDDYVTLGPGVHISGHVHLGKRVQVGTGAVIVHGTEAAPLVIGDDAIVGAGACVTKSLPAGITAVGVPAKPIHRSES